MNEIVPEIPDRDSAGALRAFVTRHATLLWVSAFAIALGAFIWREHAEMQRVGDAVSAADHRWLVLLLLVYAATLLSVAMSYRVILRRLGHEAPLTTCARIHLQRHVIGTITPIGGPASVYVLVRALGRRGVSTNDALLVTTIRGAVGYTAFVLVLIPALALQRPSAMILGASIALVGLLSVVLLALSLLLNRQHASSHLSRRLPGFAGRFLNDARAHGVRAHDLLAPLSLSLAQNLAGAASVYICLSALGFESAFGMALVGYAVGNLFTIVAPVFQGLGVVELTMALALHQQGVPMTAAVAATLLYRFGDVWFPLLLGSSVHMCFSQSVRRVGARLAPVLATFAFAAILVITARSTSGLGIFRHEYSLASTHAFAFLMALLAGVWLIGMVSGAWRRPMSQQLMPITVLVLGGPVIALFITRLDVLVPF